MEANPASYSSQKWAGLRTQLQNCQNDAEFLQTQLQLDVKWTIEISDAKAALKHAELQELEDAAFSPKKLLVAQKLEEEKCGIAGTGTLTSWLITWERFKYLECFFTGYATWTHLTKSMQQWYGTIKTALNKLNEHHRKQDLPPLSLESVWFSFQLIISSTYFEDVLTGPQFDRQWSTQWEVVSTLWSKLVLVSNGLPLGYELWCKLSSLSIAVEKNFCDWKLNSG